MPRKSIDQGTIGTRIRAAREAAGLTQAELADRVGSGLTQSHLSQLEADKHEPTLAMLRRLAAALGIEPASLL